MKTFELVLILTFSVNICSCARILALFSSLNNADQLIYRGYIEALARNNHHMVVMTPDPGKVLYPEIENIVEIDVSDVSAPFRTEYKQLVSSAEDHYRILRKLNDLALRVAKSQIKSPQISSVIGHPDVKFDMIITEADVPLLYAFAERYSAPHIAITASTGKINMYDAKGNPNHPILYPDVYSLHLGNMTLFQKMCALNRHLMYKYEYYYNYLPSCQAAADQIFGPLPRDLQTLEYDIDMLFVSGTPMMIGNRPTVPAIVYLDRMHIKPGYPLLKDTLELMDRSSKGVIYISLGLTFESNSLTKEVIQMFMRVFKQLPYTVLWKFENNTDIGLSVPSNVHLRPWFQQQEILAHSNLKAFITHGGPRSVEEAIYYKVPIVGIPFVVTNRVLLERVIKFNGGIVLDPSYLEKNLLKSALIEVASNVSFKHSMDKLNFIVYDQPWTGVDRAVWWTDYVMRHNGARHLRAPAVAVPAYKYFMLDLIATLLLLLIVIATAFAMLFKRIIYIVKMKLSGSKTKWKVL